MGIFVIHMYVFGYMNMFSVTSFTLSLWLPTMSLCSWAPSSSLKLTSVVVFYKWLLPMMVVGSLDLCSLWCFMVIIVVYKLSLPMMVAGSLDLCSLWFLMVIVILVATNDGCRILRSVWSMVFDGYYHFGCYRWWSSDLKICVAYGFWWLLLFWLSDHPCGLWFAMVICDGVDLYQDLC